MPKRVHKFYSRAEKSAFLAQVDRLYQAGGRTYVSIARELGLNDTSYHNWLSQGIKPTPAAAVTTSAIQRVYNAAEREQLVAAIDASRARGNSMKSACQAAGIAAGIDHKASMNEALNIGVFAAVENARELLPARNLTRLP